MYNIAETVEAKNDVKNLAAYMMYHLMNGQAAIDFLNLYDQQIHNLVAFPFGYRGVKFEYHGYEIRLKAFSSYHIFFIIDELKHQIIILRVLKNRQNWKAILRNIDEYSF